MSSRLSCIASERPVKRCQPTPQTQWQLGRSCSTEYYYWELKMFLKYNCFNWVITIIVLSAMRRAQKPRYRSLSRKWRTRPMKPISISAFQQFFKLKLLTLAGNFFDNYERHFDNEGTHIHQTTLLVKGIVITKSPKNVKWIPGKNFAELELRK